MTKKLLSRCEVKYGGKEQMTKNLLSRCGRGNVGFVLSQADMDTEMLNTGETASDQPLGWGTVQTQLPSKADLQNATVLLTGATGDRHAPARICSQSP